ncbi:MAG: DUF1425 domain-containing protein [Pseudomonadales bacterium]|nr:DUF1425 domain-containing protein [Pseudomonadales bacterium]
MLKTTLKKSLAIAITSIIATTFLSACSSNEDKPYVEYENSAMDKFLEVGEPRTRRKYDMLQFSVDLTNRTSSPLKFQYKLKFFDVDKFEVAKDGRPWTPVTLSAKETTSVQVSAPDATVIGAKIYIKEN